MRLPVPTPEEVKDGRLRANLSQIQACDVVGIKEVMTWSNCERRKADGTPIARMDPVRWAYFRLKTGQHPEFVMVPRMGVSLPKATTALRRRGPSLPDTDVSFALQQHHRRHWVLLQGGSYTTLSGACAATEAVQRMRGVGRLRIVRYLNDEPDQVVHSHGTKGADRPRKFSLRPNPRMPSWARREIPSGARVGWRR